MIDEENLNDHEYSEAEDSEQHSIRIEATMEADRDKFMRRTCLNKIYNQFDEIIRKLTFSQAFVF